jgi:hypothetical protein
MLHVGCAVAQENFPQRQQVVAVSSADAWQW